MAPAATADEDVQKHDEKHKKSKDKSSKSEKKRAREEDDEDEAGAADATRKHKKSKSVSNGATDVIDTEPAPSDANVAHEDGDSKKKKKKKKDRKHHEDETADAQTHEGETATTDSVKAEKKSKKRKKKHGKDYDDDDALAQNAATEPSKPQEAEKKHKKKKKHHDGQEADLSDDERKDKKKKKKSKKHEEDQDDVETVQPDEQHDASATGGDAMDVDTAPSSKRSKIHQPADIPANPQFPFFTQTVSLYEPLYPVGWSEPITSCQQQHLRHLQNRYVPSLRGVLLDYKNVAFGENSGRAGAATADDEPSHVISKNEFGVGFGWITADVELFVPSRGAWMEGSVNLQTEGHIGVVCFGRFNASIEARRLPSDWKWVPNDSDAAIFEDNASLVTADDHGVVRQLHSTGHWADASGEKVKGKIRFRIRNFDVGTAGDSTYLSLEGTMLNREGEKKLVAEEAQAAKSRKARKGGVGGARGSLAHHRRRAPDFSMTRFEGDGEVQTQTPDLGEEKPEHTAVSRMTTDE